MAERRRLLIEPARLRGAQALSRIGLTVSEARYLKRVLRLRPGAEVHVVSGCGQLFSTRLTAEGDLALDSDLGALSHAVAAPQPPLGLAVSLMRRGMDEVMRMACELGVDRLQPLQAQRCVPQAEYRPDRWGVILREAVEQCERLWAPELLPVLSTDEWWGNLSAENLRLIAVTRDKACSDLSTLLAAEKFLPGGCWITIGPEGGWSSTELQSAAEAGWCGVGLGDTILRSSTAAVAAATALCSWRRELQRT